MSGWGKSSKTPGPAVTGGEVSVQKVEKIKYVNLAHIKPPVHGGSSGSIGNKPWKAQPWTAAKKPESPGDDINSMASRFIDETKNRWRLGL